MDTGFTQDLKAFLAKPFAIQKGVLQSTDAVNTFSYIATPSAIINQEPYVSKMKGFVGFRAKAVFRLQVNANRFQQGRYMLIWIPSGGGSTTTNRGILWRNSRIATLYQRTQLPHVELDLCCDTEATLVVPYVSALNYFPVNSTGLSVGDTGTVFITPYVALSYASGSSTAAYTLWVHFEDVQLIAPTVPQSGKMFSKAKSNTAREQASVGVGPVGSTLAKISKSSGILTQIPLLSAFAGPLSWATDIMSQAVNVFGWSRPINLQPVGRMRQEVFPYNTNVDTVDNVQILAYTAKNEVSVLPGFAGTDIDEMDFANFVTIPSFYETVSWSAGNSASSLLATFPLKPDSYTTNYSTGTVTAAAYVPVAWLAQYFNLWRGGFTFTFKFVKTEFHSGRLLFAFIPYANTASAPTITFDLTAFVHREIIDIRHANEFSFTVPFTAIQSYLSIGEAFGECRLYVVDPLTAPATVSSTVTIIVEVSGTPDFEFAVPIATNLQPIYGVTPQSGAMFGGSKNVADPCMNTDGYVGNARMVTDANASAINCIGEKIVSLRAMLRAPTLAPSFAASGWSTAYQQILPFGVNGVVTSATIPITYLTGADFYSMLSSIFALSRGGVRLKGVPTTATTFSDNTPCIVSLSSPINGATSVLYVNNPTTTAYDGTATSNSFVTGLFQPFHLSKSGGYDVQIPQYNEYHSRPSQDHIAMGSTYPYSFTQTALTSRLVVNVSAPLSGSQAFYYARSGADDCNFGLFTCIPLMYFQIPLL
jgi:hypothetical protein